LKYLEEKVTVWANLSGS